MASLIVAGVVAAVTEGATAVAGTVATTEAIAGTAAAVGATSELAIAGSAATAAASVAAETTTVAAGSAAAALIDIGAAAETCTLATSGGLDIAGLSSTSSIAALGEVGGTALTGVSSMTPTIAEVAAMQAGLANVNALIAAEDAAYFGGVTAAGASVGGGTTTAAASYLSTFPTLNSYLLWGATSAGAAPGAVYEATTEAITLGLSATAGGAASVSTATLLEIISSVAATAIGAGFGIGEAIAAYYVTASYAKKENTEELTECDAYQTEVDKVIDNFDPEELLPEAWEHIATQTEQKKVETTFSAIVPEHNFLDPKNITAERLKVPKPSTHPFSLTSTVQHNDTYYYQIVTSLNEQQRQLFDFTYQWGVEIKLSQNPPKPF
ncbi:extracellular protease-like [Mya arenaria]|uniref:extracellular protease-like n=1 Tax=Mya arenaria TaxID=6604 RepID=UPI0022E4F8D7|nr:extracellular protease-like [Mya arenaria]